MARSITDIAWRASGWYGPPDTQGNYESAVEEAWRELVSDCGDIYRLTLETPLVIEQREFDLVSLAPRYRQLEVARLAYTPRTISSISRAAGGTVTVVTATAHRLAVGIAVRIAGVTGAAATTFNGDFEVVTITGVDPTSVQFTYTDTETAADTGSGAAMQVQQAGNPVALGIKKESSVGPEPQYHAADSAGNPQNVYFPNAYTLAVDPLSDGSYPALWLEYDAEAPDGDALNRSDELPLPSWVEKGLIGYALVRVADDPRWQQQGERDWQETFQRARRRHSDRRASNRAT